MVFNKSIGEIIDFSILSIFKDSKALKYFIIVAIISILSGVIMSLLTAQMYSFDAFSNPMEIIKTIMLMSIISGAIGLLTWVLLIIFEYLTIKRALEISGEPHINLDLLRFFKFIFVGIGAAIYAILSIFKLKTLAIGIIGIVLIFAAMILILIGSFIGEGIILGIIAAILIIVGIILLIYYAIMVIINMLRLSVGTVIFVREDIGIGDALKKSWDMSEGNAGKIFVAGIVLGLIIGIIAAIVSGPATIYLIGTIVSNVGTQIDSVQEDMFTSSFDNSMYPGFEFNKSDLMANKAFANAMADPIYILLLIPSFIVQALGLIASSFFVVALYNAMKGTPIQKQNTPQKEKTW